MICCSLCSPWLAAGSPRTPAWTHMRRAAAYIWDSAPRSMGQPTRAASTTRWAVTRCPGARGPNPDPHRRQRPARCTASSGDEWGGKPRVLVPGAPSLSARLNWRGSQSELFEVFPFRHDLDYQARRVDGRLQLDLTVHARGADAVPLAFGFHPYLSLSGVPRERWLVELPALRHLALTPPRSRSGPQGGAGPTLRACRAGSPDDAFDQVPNPPGLPSRPEADGSRSSSWRVIPVRRCSHRGAPSRSASSP